MHDLSPVAGMKLESLDCTATRIKDLDPLRGMPLMVLRLSPLATDLSPLEGIKLRNLQAGAARRGFAVLQDMPLETLDISFIPWRDSALLRSIKTLKQVNSKPASESHAWADWEDSVRTAPPEKHLDMVKAKLVEINGPGTEVKSVRADKNVTELECFGDFKDISPVRVLSKLQALHLGRGKQNVAIDINALTGMQLKKLTIHDARPVDWAVLRELPLEEFEAHGQSMTSLEPLRGLQLKVLKATYSKVNNLEPLRGTPLKVLDIGASEVSDLAPLADMKLTGISISSSKVSDISVLKGMPLEYFRCGSGTTDLSPLRGAPLKVLYLNQHPGPRLDAAHGHAARGIHRANARRRGSAILTLVPEDTENDQRSTRRGVLANHRCQGARIRVEVAHLSASNGLNLAAANFQNSCKLRTAVGSPPGSWLRFGRDNDVRSWSFVACAAEIEESWFRNRPLDVYAEKVPSTHGSYTVRLR